MQTSINEQSSFRVHFTVRWGKCVKKEPDRFVIVIFTITVYGTIGVYGSFVFTIFDSFNNRVHKEKRMKRKKNATNNKVYIHKKYMSNRISVGSI